VPDFLFLEPWQIFNLGCWEKGEISQPGVLVKPSLL
jgi:hypothetical protein